MRKDYKRFDLVGGEVFGRLTYTGKTYFSDDASGRSRRRIEAVCQCGVVRDYNYGLVMRGASLSCGCLKSDLLRANPINLTHGLTGHRLYTIWRGMRERCYYEKNKNYKRYGGVGISVCEEWRNDFKPFYDWSMKNGYNEKLTLDRRDGLGDYTPENCRFATPKMQGNNRKSNVFYTAFGETKSMEQWSKDGRCIVGYNCLKNRLFLKERWTVELALTTPVIHSSEVDRKTAYKNILTAFGESKTLAEWVEDERCTVNLEQLRTRLKKKWNPEKAVSGKLRETKTVIALAR